jgi:hypothetical protein
MCQHVLLMLTTLQRTDLVRFIENREVSGIFVLRGILKVLDIFADDFPIGNEVPHSVDHVRYHHNLIRLLIRELQWLFGSLNIVGHDDRFGSLDPRCEAGEFGIAPLGVDSVPQTDPNIFVRSEASASHEVTLWGRMQ